jgi:hypothetical protein
MVRRRGIGKSEQYFSPTPNPISPTSTLTTHQCSSSPTSSTPQPSPTSSPNAYYSKRAASTTASTSGRRSARRRKPALPQRAQLLLRARGLPVGVRPRQQDALDAARLHHRRHARGRHEHHIRPGHPRERAEGARVEPAIPRRDRGVGFREESFVCEADCVSCQINCAVGWGGGPDLEYC